MTALTTTLVHEDRSAKPPEAERPVRLRLGAVHVVVRSELPEALEDYRHLYRHALVRSGEPTDAQDTIVVEARARLPLPAPMRRYTIYGDGEVLFRGRSPREVLPYLEWAINWRVVARQDGYLQLHAAALSHRGRGVILAGPSGSGKSTLAAALVARGWRYLCDEFALVDPATLHLEPFPKAMCIKAGSFAVVRELGLPLWDRRHYAKAFKGRVGYLSPAALGPEVIGEPCPIEAVIFPQYTASLAPVLAPMPRAEAAVELARQAFNRQQFRHSGTALIAAAVRGARCYRLDAGAVQRTCRAIENALN